METFEAAAGDENEAAERAERRLEQRAVAEHGPRARHLALDRVEVVRGDRPAVRHVEVDVPAAANVVRHTNDQAQVADARAQT